jgi:hypothetical protein
VLAGAVVVVVWAVRVGGARSTVSAGLPMRYPAIPEPSIKATTRAAHVDLFMKSPA